MGLENEDDLFLWNIVFQGPEDTLYEVNNILDLNIVNHAYNIGWVFQSKAKVP